MESIKMPALVCPFNPIDTNSVWKGACLIYQLCKNTTMISLPAVINHLFGRMDITIYLHQKACLCGYRVCFILHETEQQCCQYNFAQHIVAGHLNNHIV
eukprot:8327906-Ditylum_brightwellii.AAC.1